MKSSSGLSLTQRFKVHSENICALILDAGLVIRPYSNPSLSFFALLSETEKIEVIRDLQIYYQICLDVKMEGGSLRDPKHFTEKALLRQGLNADPFILEQIKSDNLVEAYTFSGTQIFRTLLFFEVCSYTLEDLYCRKWYHLYERAPEDQKNIEDTIGLFMSNPDKALEVPNKEHVIHERDSLERLSIRNKMYWMAPLKKEGKTEAILTIAKASLA
ncbi:hypothetical protein [Bdellovibrio sp. HCB-110]|uniref:hypothetical protein n=1 Tax=Bdellovibrio sp. HCB-110 TaxID=3391182 RepID=UPI0039B63A72